MKYKVLLDKLDKLAHKGSESEVELVVQCPTSKLQQTEGMLFLENRQNILVDQHNVINKMVRRLPNDYAEQDRPTFPTLRLRPPFTIPDSSVADLPEPINRSGLTKKISYSKLTNEASLPEYGPRLARLTANNVRGRIVSIFNPETPDQRPVQLVPRIRTTSRKVRVSPPRPRTPPPPRIRTPPPSTAHASVHASTSSSVKNDDKDFEIPLEESLQAVANFKKMEKALSIWSIGEYVLARWKGNGLFYRAKILDINITGEILVFFDSYDIEDTINHEDMLKFYRKDKNYVKKLGSRKVPVSVPVSAPVSVPVSAPVSVPVSAPVSVPVSAPVSTPVSASVSVPVKDDAKPDKKIKCAKKPRDERLKKASYQRSKVPLCKRSNMLRKQILRTYQRIRQQKVHVEYFSGEVQRDA